MKKRTVFLIHVFLWILVFYTFFNIQQSIAVSDNIPDYNPYSDLALIIRTVSTLLMLAVPFYSGYIIGPYLFNKKERKSVISVVVLFGLFYPLALSLADDGLRLSAIRQFFFAFAFLSLFMVLGMGVKSLLGLAEQNQ
jgi:hypothetical protein